MRFNPVAVGATPHRWAILLTMLGVVAATAASTTPSGAAPPARDAPVHAWVKHTVFTGEQGMPHPAGVAYSPRDGALLVAARRSGGGTSLLVTNTAGRRIASVSLPDELSGASVTFDPATGKLVGLAAASLVLVDEARAASGAVAATYRSAHALPERTTDLAFDTVHRHLLVLYAGTRKIAVLAMSTSGRLARLSTISLAALPAGRVAGLAYRPSDGLIYVAIQARAALYAVDLSGTVRASYDLSRVHVSQLRSMTFAPTADPTDAPSSTSLYLADSGSSTTGGGIVEVYLTTAPTVPVTATATLVNTIATSDFSPPSPDPAGITYLPGPDKLLPSDSEVDEMTLFQQVNLWTLSRTGTVSGTGVTTLFSHEPTGVSYDTRTGHLFVSDDDQQKIFDLAAGPDGRFGTGDDTWTSFSASKAGDLDPEDVTIDTDTGDLFLIDGVGTEVWQISPGPNQKFDGVPPTGDDVVSHFDIGQFGAGDPEGICYSADRGTLFVVDSVSHAVYELTTAGELVNAVDITAAGGNAEAAITLAPSTAGTGTSFYITDRRQDNDVHPDENDGRIYEMLPNLPEGGNTPPRVLAGANQTLAFGQRTVVSASVTDDGLPTDPGRVTTTWSTVTGPGTVTFGDPAALETTVTFSAPGSYTLRITASDGELSSLDDLVVRVYGPDENLIGNPGFETDTKGWNTGGNTSVTLTRVTPGHSGSYAAALTNTSASPVRCVLNDGPNWVATTTTTVAAHYAARLWVRGQTAGAVLELRLREYSGSTLVGGASTNVTLRTDWQQVAVDYTPVAPGASTLDLTATVYNAAPATCFLADDAAITVRAAGTAATVTPTSIDFGAQGLGQASAAQQIRIDNVGDSALRISGITLSGDGADEFVVDQGDCTSVQAGQSCTFDITFAPSRTGAVTATATIVSDAASGDMAVQLSGTGGVPLLSSDVRALDFGTQTGPSAPRTVTVHNDGGGPATVTGVDVTGDAAADFAATSDCVGTTLAPGDSCTISVTFTPSAVGPRQASFDVLADGTQLSVSLTGTGQSLIVGQPDTLDFGSQGVGTTSAAQMVTVTNASSPAIDAVTVSITGPQQAQFAATSTCTSLAPSASCTVSVSFRPTTVGQDVATLVVSAAGAASPATVALAGAGTPVADLSLASISGSIQPAAGSTQSYTVAATNKGPSPASATLSVVLPSGLSFVSVNRTGCTVPAAGSSGGTVTCSGISLAAGASASLTITVIVTAKRASKLTLKATVADPATYDPATGNNTKQLNITVK
jgi:uncharacterized repeat protein (TIGR01451 family)